MMTSTGTAVVPLAPGRYRVTASRGPAYDSRSEEVVVTPTATARASFLLHRVVDTAGYVAHERGLVSSRLAIRAIGFGSPCDAADGIEIAVVADHAALVIELALSPFLAALQARRPRRRGTEAVRGRVNVFPVSVRRGDLTPANSAKRDDVVADYLAILASGRLVTPMASSDAAGVADGGPWHPRTFIRVSDDASLHAGGAARAADLVNGLVTRRDVVLSDAPFVRVSANGVGLGGIAKGRDVVVKVHVECAGSMCVDNVRLVRARGKEQMQRVKLAPLPSTALGADAVFRVHADKDDAFVVIASDPSVSGSWSMTSAVFIDADGDGKALGR